MDKLIFGALALILFTGINAAHADHEITLEDEQIELIEESDLERIPLEPVRPLPLPGRLCRGLPDLVITGMPRPQYDERTDGSILRAVIRNQGNVDAGPFIARLTDGITNVSVMVPGLARMTSRTVIFRLPYWIFNPDASYSVKADASNRVNECNERNNVRSYFELG